MHGVRLAKELLNRPRKGVLIYGDPDVDGLMAMKLACEWFEERGKKFFYFVNGNRHHGFVFENDRLDKIKDWLIVAVDFTVEKADLQRIVDKNVSILVIDHHDIDDKEILRIIGKNGACALVLNNQYCFEKQSQKYLSGAGCVYEIFYNIDKNFRNAEREAMVGVTLLSDARPLETEGARYYLKKAYTAPYQGFVRYLIDELQGLKGNFNFGKPKLERSFIDYVLSPTINSLLRFDETDIAIDYILGNGLRDRTTHEKQKIFIETLKKTAEISEFDNYKLVCVNEENIRSLGYNAENFIGLLASNLKGSGKSVFAFIEGKNGEIKRASFRGRYNDVRYREGFVSIGIDARGHGAAFGMVGLSDVNILKNRINTLIGKLEQGHCETATIHETANLSIFLLNHGEEIAKRNCYVRELYREYIRYTGKNIKEERRTYGAEDENGNKKVSYIEYSVDGRKVKSFGVEIENSLILPIEEGGILRLYLKEDFE